MNDNTPRKSNIDFGIKSDLLGIGITISIIAILFLLSNGSF